MHQHKIPKLNNLNWEQLMDFDLKFETPRAKPLRMSDEKIYSGEKRRVRSNFHRSRWG